MSLTLSTMLVAATVTLPSCSWDKPGAQPYMGDMEAAVDRYRDIPPDVRQKLKARLRARTYDDIATISRDKIEGKRSYSNLRDMHFANGRVCRQVTRTKWAPEAIERGLVYCEGEHCLIVPTVCRNVSRVTADTPLDFETAAGNDEPPVLANQRFVGDPEPLAMRRLQLDPPPGSPDDSPLDDVTAAGPDPTPTPPGPPPQPLPPFQPIPLPPPVPEPSTWVMMLAGLALVARLARRRAAQAGVAAQAGRASRGLSWPGA